MPSPLVSDTPPRSTLVAYPVCLFTRNSVPVADWMTSRARWSGVCSIPLAPNPAGCTHSPVSGKVVTVGFARRPPRESE